jgi:hypothetical protein
MRIRQKAGMERRFPNSPNVRPWPQSERSVRTAMAFAVHTGGPNVGPCRCYNGTLVQVKPEITGVPESVGGCRSPLARHHCSKPAAVRLSRGCHGSLCSLVSAVPVGARLVPDEAIARRSSSVDDVISAVDINRVASNEPSRVMSKECGCGADVFDAYQAVRRRLGLRFFK